MDAWSVYIGTRREKLARIAVYVVCSRAVIRREFLARALCHQKFPFVPTERAYLRPLPGGGGGGGRGVPFEVETAIFISARRWLGLPLPSRFARGFQRD